MPPASRWHSRFDLGEDGERGIAAKAMPDRRDSLAFFNANHAKSRWFAPGRPGHVTLSRKIRGSIAAG